MTCARNAAAPGTDRLHNGVAQLHDEAAGVLRLHILAPHDALDLLAGALLGNAEAASLARVLVETIKRIETAPPSDLMECACCTRPLRRGAVICVAVADRPDPGCGLAFALCSHCTRHPAGLLARASEALANIWPDARAIEITHPGGGAA